MVLKVSGLWILAAIPCELQADFLLSTRMQQRPVKGIAFWLLGIQCSNFPALRTAVLKCGGTHGYPKEIKLPWPELEFSFSPFSLIQFHW